MDCSERMLYQSIPPSKKPCINTSVILLVLVVNSQSHVFLSIDATVQLRILLTPLRTRVLLSRHPKLLLANPDLRFSQLGPFDMPGVKPSTA